MISRLLKIRKTWCNATCKAPTGTCNPIESESGQNHMCDTHARTHARTNEFMHIHTYVRAKRICTK